MILKKIVSYMIPVDKSMSLFLKQRQRYLRNSKHSSQMAIDTPYKKLPHMLIIQ